MKNDNSNAPDSGGAVPVTPRQQYLNIIQKGFALLKERKDYTQASIVGKLETLQLRCSVSLFNKIIKQSDAGDSSLRGVSKGIKEIVLSELGLVFNSETQQFTEKPARGWNEKVIPDNSVQSAVVNGMEFHLDGRVRVEYKTDFFADAKEDVIEIGLRLNTFTNYFTSMNPTVYKNHIIKLLENGVNVKAFLIDPESNEARLYFEDRARYQPLEINGPRDIKSIIERLVDVVKEINARGYSGKFQVYTYKHFPYANFFVVDGATQNGKMIVSHYIYGVKRAEGPSWEFSKQSNNHLYAIYWESVQKYIEGAKPITGV